MTKSMTGSFYLTETVNLALGTPAGTRVQGSIDLSAYVNVPTGQAIAIESVDFVYQGGTDNASDVKVMLAASGGITTQLTDLNPGTVFVLASNHSLVASGCLNIDQPNSVASHSSDFYPDNFGPANLSEAFLVVNDTLYLVAGNDSAATFAEVNVTARIRARVVKLSTKDWMAIAIQSTAADN
tara:strand:- start:1183 stop:1731 length:549 start_codon:yes stop_codon:yes gene_type:complete